jgi:hypothetical protein
VDIKEEEKAMDFFHGLDNGRYAAFKSNMLNGWAAEAFNPPGTINQIFRIAATWVKPVPRGDGGTAVSYVTLEDDAKGKAKKKEQQKKQQAKKQAAATVVVTAADAETTKDVDQKVLELRREGTSSKLQAVSQSEKEKWKRWRWISEWNMAR